MPRTLSYPDWLSLPCHYRVSLYDRLLSRDTDLEHVANPKDYLGVEQPTLSPFGDGLYESAGVVTSQNTHHCIRRSSQNHEEQHGLQT